MSTRYVTSTAPVNTSGNGQLTPQVLLSSANKLAGVILRLLVNTGSGSGTGTATVSSYVQQVSISGHKKTYTDGYSLAAGTLMMKYIYPEINALNVDPVVAAAATNYTGYYFIPFNGLGAITIDLTTKESSAFAGITQTGTASITFDVIGVILDNDAISYNYHFQQVQNQTSFTKEFSDVYKAGLYSSADSIYSVWSSGPISQATAHTLERAQEEELSMSNTYILILDHAQPSTDAVSLSSGAAITYMAVS
jgi:hypothetical protein